MSFFNEKKQCKTTSDLEHYLSGIPRPRFIIGSTYHNTYRPDIHEWRGVRSMESMQKTYEGKSWDRGPHFFVAVGAPDPGNDGIWIMTPPSIPGTHAGICNGDNDPVVSGRWGWELVGDFHTRFPTYEQLDLLTSGISLLHKWIGIGPDINAHRDCMPGRTCPGDSFYSIKSRVIEMVREKLGGDGIWERWGLQYPLPEEQRGFGIPSAWYENMIGSPGRRLGAAVSGVHYSGNTVIQMFENGLIVHRNGFSRIIVYRDFRVP